jgi:biotin carboxyl carrier protein
MRWQFKTGDKSGKAADLLTVELLKIEEGRYHFRVNEKQIVIDRVRLHPSSIHSDLGSLAIESWNKEEWRVTNTKGSFTLKPVSLEANQKSGGGLIKSQMPGKILKILVKEGESVVSGQSLLIMEAMKMENEIRAEMNATVKKISVSPSTSVEAGALLIELEAQ